VLTDRPDLALKSAEPPPFVDPFLFRVLVQGGRVQPTELIRRIDNQEYDIVLSTAQIVDPTYERYQFGYPPVVAQAIRRQYVFRSHLAGMFLYQRREK